MPSVLVSSPVACGKCSTCVEHTLGRLRPPVNPSLLALGVPAFLHPETRVCVGVSAEHYGVEHSGGVVGEDDVVADVVSNDCILKAMVDGPGPRSLVESDSDLTMAMILALPSSWFKSDEELSNIGVEQVDGEHVHLLEGVPDGCIDFRSFIRSVIIADMGDAGLAARFTPAGIDSSLLSLRTRVGNNKHRRHLGATDCCRAGRKKWPEDSSPIAASRARNGWFHYASKADVDHFFVQVFEDFDDADDTECVEHIFDDGSVLMPVHATRRRGRHISIESTGGLQLCVPVGACVEVIGARFAPTVRPVILTFTDRMRVKIEDSSFVPEVMWVRRMSGSDWFYYWADTEAGPRDTAARFFTKSGARIMAVLGLFDVDPHVPGVPEYRLDDPIWSEEDPCPPGCSIYRTYWTRPKLTLDGDRFGTTYECASGTMEIGPCTLRRNLPIALSPNLLALAKFEHPGHICVVRGVDDYELDDGGLSADDDDFLPEY